MKFKKLLTTFFAMLPIAIFADFSAKTLQENSLKNVELIKKIAEAQEAWQAEKNQLNARLATQETLNARLKEELAEVKTRSEKSKIASSEILISLEKFKVFEANLEKLLSENSKSFLEKIQTPPANFILKNQLGLEGTFKDVYAFVEAAIEARTFALDFSKLLSVQSVEGEDVLFVGICAALKKTKCDGVSKIIDILKGEAAHEIIEISIEGSAK